MKDLRNLYVMISELETIKVKESYIKSAQAQVKELEARLINLTNYNQSSEDNSKVNLSDMARQAQFSASLTDLISAALQLINNTLKLEELSNGTDHDTTSYMLFNIVQGYTSIPEVQIAYLKQMEIFQVDKKNYAEAGMCGLMSAKIIYEHIKQDLSVSIPFDDALKVISPTMLQLNFASALNTGSDQFSIVVFSQTLDRIIKYFKQAELYEYVILLNTVLVPYFTSQRDFPSLANVYSAQNLLYSNLAIIDTGRIFPTYYRVEFVGKGFKDLNNTEWVYRSKDRLFDFTQKLQNAYAGQKITILDSTKSTEGLDDNKLFMKVTTIQPYVSQAKNEQIDQFYHHNSVSTFVLETPFVLGDSKVRTDDITKQCKRKIFLNVNDTFPSLVTRQKITSSKTVELSPIENAIEEIEKRFYLLQTEIFKIKATPSERKEETQIYHSLRMLLQGSLRLQVNGGAAEICSAFFTNPDMKNAKNLKILKDKLLGFLALCKTGIELEREAKDSLEVFNSEMNEGYNQLRQIFKANLEGI